MVNSRYLAGAVLLGRMMFGQQACESLKSMRLPHAEITSAAESPEGSVTFGGPNATPVQLPSRCIVKAVSRPTSDSEIGIEIWLPVSTWNGKYMQVGNGGWAGSIPASSLATAILRGYAAAGTNDGHEPNHPAGPAGWAIGHPEKLIDFGHRALHETAVLARALVSAYYVKNASRSYFFGCSDGGREALMEAQRYPEDFNGIIAGAPANDWSNHKV